MTNAPLQPGIDLHAHTTASDGSLTPAELVHHAVSVGLTTLAVTDHDTLAGLDEAIEAARYHEIELVPGVELSVEDEQFKFHMLGYLFDVKKSEFAETLEDLRQRRKVRNDKMIEKATEIGLPLDWDDVAAELAERGEVVGRPHIAAAMVKKGIVQSRQEAFDHWLTPGKPLYFSKHGLSPQEGITRLHEAGGIAVMAHPGLTKWPDPASLERILRTLKGFGLDGLEVYYSQHSAEQTEAYRQIAERLGLIVTGGSDFHGDPKPHVFLGEVIGTDPAPATLLPAMKERAAEYRAASQAAL